MRLNRFSFQKILLFEIYHHALKIIVIYLKLKINY